MTKTGRNITLVVRSQPRRARYNLIGAVKITPDAEIALRDLNAQTGLSMRQIASSLITQAASCVEIVDMSPGQRRNNQ